MTDAYNIFNISLLVAGFFSVVAAFWILKITPERLPFNEKLPRAFYPGAVIAIIDIIWCVPNTRPVIPLSMQDLIIPGAVICVFLALKFLDYLFARALGGLLILTAHYFLHESFTYHTPWAPFFVILCFTAGIIGLFFAGKPYLMRDIIRKSATDREVKYAFTAFFTVFGLTCLTNSIIQFLR